MAELLISDCKPFGYQSAQTPESIELLGALELWNDEHSELVAAHHFLKRDGDLQEPMGSQSSVFVFTCVFFAGQVPDLPGDQRTPYARYADTYAFFRRNKRGTLTHPQLGQVPVVFRGMSAAHKPAAEGSSVTFTLRLAEDQLDGTLVAEPAPGALGAKVVDAAAGLQSKAKAAFEKTQALKLKFQGVLSEAARFYSLGYTLTTTALAAYNAIKQDPSLLGVLGALVGSGESLVGELRRQGVVGVDAYPYASAARTTIAAGAELYQAVADRGPGTETYQPQAPATLQAICVERYGAKDAPAMVQEALRLNPRFRGPLVKPGERIILPRKVRPQ